MVWLSYFYKGPLSLLIVFIVICFAALGLDNMSNGALQPYKSDHCATGQYMVKNGGVPCTATRQDFGWPIKKSTRFTQAVALNQGEWVPDRFSECLSACGPRSLSDNFILLAAVIGLPLAVLKVVTMLQFNRELKQQEADLRAQEQQQDEENHNTQF